MESNILELSSFSPFLFGLEKHRQDRGIDRSTPGLQSLCKCLSFSGAQGAFFEENLRGNFLRRSVLLKCKSVSHQKRLPKDAAHHRCNAVEYALV